jgi:hypothetical protein
MRAYAVRLLRLRRIEFSVHTGRASQRKREVAMFELIICSLVTIIPDYLYRRYVQNKRFGKEITFYSVWYELRWG